MRHLKFGSSIISFCLCPGFHVLRIEYRSAEKTSTEINFSTEDFQHVLTKAKASHKKVFADAYATWCAPCKKLQESTFKDAKAAAYFNKHFVNFSIDVEKGYGIELGQSMEGRRVTRTTYPR